MADPRRQDPETKPGTGPKGLSPPPPPARAPPAPGPSPLRPTPPRDPEPAPCSGRSRRANETPAEPGPAGPQRPAARRSPPSPHRWVPNVRPQDQGRVSPAARPPSLSDSYTVGADGLARLGGGGRERRTPPVLSRVGRVSGAPRGPKAHPPETRGNQGPQPPLRRKTPAPSTRHLATGTSAPPPRLRRNLPTQEGRTRTRDV